MNSNWAVVPGLFVLLSLLQLSGCDEEHTAYVYKNVEMDTETRVADLISRMTLEEKIRQLDMYSANEFLDRGKFSATKASAVLDGRGIGSVRDFYPETAEIANELQKYVVEESRLGIPAIVIEEALHGYLGVGATSFPVPIGLASMWDVGLMERVGSAIATEARSVGVHMVLAPVLGLGREPRWGRVQETFGEDAFLAARKGVAIIHGLQGDDLSHDDAVVAEPKHFGIHSIPEGGKNTAPVYIGEREARSHFLYVFEKAFKEGGALGAMSAYHEWDGVPAAADPWLLTKVLREEWGFKGMVLSDLGAINKQIVSHYTAATPKEAIINSIRAGLDMQFFDNSHEVFRQAILEGVDEGSLPVEAVDRAVAGVLYVKFKLGLFENPYTDPALKELRYHSDAHRKLAHEAAQRSIVLLQNKRSVLPFGEEVRNVAIIGELANKTLLGGYSARGVSGVSIVDAFKQTDYNVVYVDAGVPSDFMEEIDARYLVTEDGQKGLLAEYFNNTEFKGDPDIVQVETELTQYWHNRSPAPGVSSDNFSVRWSGFIVPELTGVYEIELWADDLGRLTIDGKVLIDSWDVKHKNSWSRNTIRLEQGKQYEVKLELAKLVEFADIKIRWKISPDESINTNMFEEAIAAAEVADVVVLVLGEKEDNGEGVDKVSLELNNHSKQLLKDVAAAGKPLVLVLQNGRPLVLTEEVKLADAILETWYSGEQSGAATVDILTGKVNPSGRLPVSFPRYNGQLPIYYNQKKSATATYVDGSNKPLFAFGYGLSYSEFAYSGLQIEKPEIGTGEEQLVKVSVRNTSDRSGTEVVQLYVTDAVSSVSTPKLQLRGFQRVSLRPDEEKEMVFVLQPDDLSLWNMEMNRVVEPGEFVVRVGAASDDIRLESSFWVK